jgi:hypothetical protein
MARKNKRNPNPVKGFFASLLAGGATLLGYSLLFPFYRWNHYIIGGALALLLGRVAYIMFSGLDTSQKAASMEDLPLTGNSAVDQLVARGQQMLQDIRKEDEMIPDPELSEKIVQLDGIATRIFQTVIDQPEKAPQIRRFMDYYLPTTLKMLTGYRKLQQSGVSGQSARNTKARITDAMDVVLGAFGKQLETLYQNDMLDITTDIDVLEAMLKQDSLLGSDFKINTTTHAQGGAQAQQMKEG